MIASGSDVKGHPALVEETMLDYTAVYFHFNSE